LNSAVKFWLHPFNIFWLLFLAGILAYFLKKEKVYIVLFVIAGIWFLITSNFLLPNFLITQLENQYSPFTKDKIQNDSLPYNIIVLGAGFSYNKKLPFNDQLSPTALSRLIEGVRIHNLLPESKLVVSGPGAAGEITQAEVFSKTAGSLGVDTNLISTIKTARNTFEEAKTYAEKFDKNIPVILVTSASHMPRAMMMFQKQGITAIPAPTDFQSKTLGEESISWFPSSEYMNMMKTATIEYVGILYAKWFLL
jgi:uncharacterized SAM-binding protein YcdF (DUF218 family)